MRRFLLIAAMLVACAIFGVMFWSTRESPAELIFVNMLEPRTLDPALASWADEIRLDRCLFEGLTRLNDRTFRPEPAVAERWDVSADGRCYTFHLRPNARWSNGDSITAGDFAFAWRRVLDPVLASEYFYQLYPIRNARQYYTSRADRGASTQLSFDQVGVCAVDDRTLRVELAFPCPYFLDLAAFPTLMPVHRPTVEKWAYRDGHVLPTMHLWTRPENLVCNGPFTIDRWQFKRRIRLRKNLRYWDAASIRLNSIEALPIEDTNTALLAYETGAVDLVSMVYPMSARVLYAASRKGQRPDFHHRRYFASYFYRFNCTRPPLNDPRVRRALSLTIDRDAICDRVMGFGQVPAFCLVPAGSVDEMVQRDPDGREYRYQPASGLGQDMTPAQRIDLARKLMAEAGFPGGRGIRPLELIYNREQSHHLIAQAVAKMWNDHLGLTIELKQIERNVLSPRVERLDYDIARGNWIGDYMDPMTFLDMFVSGGGHNQTGFANPQYDRLIQSATAEPHPGKRFEILRRAESCLIHDQLPITPIYEYVSDYLLNPKFGGIVPDSQLTLLVHRAFVRQGPARQALAELGANAPAELSPDGFGSASGTIGVPPRAGTTVK